MNLSAAAAGMHTMYALQPIQRTVRQYMDVRQFMCANRGEHNGLNALNAARCDAALSDVSTVVCLCVCARVYEHTNTYTHTKNNIKKEARHAGPREPGQRD